MKIIITEKKDYLKRIVEYAIKTSNVEAARRYHTPNSTNHKN